MEGLWWLILVVLIFLFGKNIPVISNLVSDFNQPNAVPTPNGMPALTTQNQLSPPENQPAPWKSICQPSGSPIAVAAGIPMPMTKTYVASPVSRVASPVARITLTQA